MSIHAQTRIPTAATPADRRRPHPAPIAVSVSREIAAPPGVLYDLVSDVVRMPEWSPETRRVRWLDGATSAAPGVGFRGDNRVGPMRWSTRPLILAADRGERFVFRTPGASGSTWTYEFLPSDSGTVVVESMEQHGVTPVPIRLMLRSVGIADRSEHLRAGMAATLDALAQAATGR